METSKRGRKRVTFKVKATPGSIVSIAGDFNNWDPSKKLLKDQNGDGSFVGTSLLPAGRHEYKIVVDGTWSVDPHCDDWAYNPFGSLNSIIVVD